MVVYPTLPGGSESVSPMALLEAETPVTTDVEKSLRIIMVAVAEY
jgi:hypothetical protein